MIINILKSVTMLQLLLSISLVNATNSTYQLNDVNEWINKQSSKSSESSDGTTENTSLDEVIRTNEISKLSENTSELDEILKIDEIKKQLSKLSIASDETVETSLDNVFNINDTEGISELSRRRVRYLNRKDYYATKLNSRCEESREQKHFDEDDDSEYSNLGFNNTTYSANQFDEDDMLEEDYNIGYNKEYSVQQVYEQPNQISEQLKQNKIEEKPKKKSIVSFIIKHLFNK